MANLTRYDPLNLARIDPFSDIDELFKGFFVHPALLEGQPHMQIKMDVKEDDGKAQAKYSGGVLELTLPKKPTNSARTLAIQ